MVLRSNSPIAPAGGRLRWLASGWSRLATAFGAGALSALALPPLGWFPVLWLTLPVFVWLLDGATSPPGASLLARARPGFVTGWSFGFGYFVGGLWWIGAAFLVDAAEFAWLMPLAVLALPAGLALFWGAGAAVARLYWPPGWRRVVLLAVWLSLAEYLRGHLLTGFPWNAFGYTLMPVPLMMQVASLVGVWGVTLLAFLVFAAPVLLFGRDGGERTADRWAFVVLAALFVADLGYGAWRLASADATMVPGVRLRLVQPMIAQDEKWASGRDDEILGRYLSLSAKGMQDGQPPPFTHLIWPETAFPFLLAEKPNALATIGALLPEGTTLITGAARAEAVLGEEVEPRVFNSLQVIDSAGVIRDSYDKVHLVPFGEYLPFEGLFRRIGLRQMVALPGGFDAGSRAATIAVPGAPAFGPLICYEIIFPGAAIDPQNRPGWLVNVTNDAWFGDTPGPWQHLHQATIRAVEEGLPVARAANSGISAVINPYGNLIADLGIGSFGVLDAPLPSALPATIYSTYRDHLYFALIILAWVVSSTGRFTRTKQRN
ncbi:apolipoprotein N-acyltransferase [Kaistia sp. 32K]|uniref:apolipoprotein N-acyltransferase n=1 Tax=Kaistia sp. 32K TaxID=2795690 RepID=UPI0019161BC1|nr:apolipoprotein N-acyltransferase [Kaistia sp. 32K]BCP55874.1 apolipoprotein N-acyltransferase [Kaistia sp. 32K]